MGSCVCVAVIIGCLTTDEPKRQEPEVQIPSPVPQKEPERSVPEIPPDKDAPERKNPIKAEGTAQERRSFIVSDHAK